MIPRVAALFLALLAVATLVFCSTEPKKSERELQIRAVNLSLVFEFLANKSVDARELRDRRTKLAAEIGDLRSKADGEGDAKGRAELVARLKKATDESAELSKKEESQKARIYAEINRAITIVAKRMDLDHVMTIGDALVYSKKEHDVTDEVIREIVRLHNRNAPASR